MNYLAHLLVATKRETLGPQPSGLLAVEPLSHRGFEEGVREFGLDGVDLQTLNFRSESFRDALGVVDMNGRSGPVVPRLTRGQLRRLVRRLAGYPAKSDLSLPPVFIEVLRTVDGRYALLPQDDDEDSASLQAFDLVSARVHTDEGSDREELRDADVVLERVDLLAGEPVAELVKCRLVLTSTSPDAHLACRSRGCSGNCIPELHSVPGTSDVRVVACDCS